MCPQYDAYYTSQAYHAAYDRPSHEKNPSDARPLLRMPGFLAVLLLLEFSAFGLAILADRLF